MRLFYGLAGLFKRYADVQCDVIRNHWNGIADAKLAALDEGRCVKADSGFPVERVVASTRKFGIQHDWLGNAVQCQISDDFGGCAIGDDARGYELCICWGWTEKVCLAAVLARAQQMAR